MRRLLQQNEDDEQRRPAEEQGEPAESSPLWPEVNHVSERMAG